MKHLSKVLITALCLPLAGCETLTAWQSNPSVQFAEMQAIKIAASFFSNGGKTDNAWGISQGVNFIGDVASFVSDQKKAKDTNAANLLAAAKLQAQVKAFASDPKAVDGLAKGLSGVLLGADPKTPEQRAQVVLAIAGAIEKVTATHTP